MCVCLACGRSQCQHLQHSPGLQCKWSKLDRPGYRPFSQEPPLFKQAMPHPAPCQPTTNSLQSGSLCSLECVCAEPSPCHIPTSEGRESPGSSDSSVHHTGLSCSAFSPADSELHRVRGIKGCQSVWLCSPAGVIHSSFAQTGLCVRLTAGLLNQHGEHTHTHGHTGTGADVLLIQARLGVSHQLLSTCRLSDDRFGSARVLLSHVQHGALCCLSLKPSALSAQAQLQLWKIAHSLKHC